MDVLTSFLGREGFLPHGYCFTWSPGLLWSMVGADATIALAYFSIPLGIFSFVRQRGDPSLRLVAGLFCGFIFACGLTHVMDVWTIWRPDYGLQALSKLGTAAISLATAIVLWRLIPSALRIPSVHQLQSVIDSLEAEVSQRRSAQDSLADTQQSLAVTLASIEAGFIATDRDGRVTRLNATAETLLGWPEAEALGQSRWSVLVREDRPVEMTQLNPVDVMLRDGVTIDTAHRITVIARGGQRRPAEVKAALIHTPDGTVRGVAIVLRDLTRQLLAEAATERLAALVESSEDAIISKSLGGIIQTWNPGAESLFGYTAQEATGKSIQMLIPPDRADEEVAILARVARGERVETFDTVRQRKGGGLLDVSITISPIRDQGGRVVGASKIARDISQRKRQDDELRRSNAELEQFAYVASHDLQEPLRMVVSYSELLAQRYQGKLDQKADKYIHYAVDGARRMQRLVADLMAYSRVGSQGKPLVPVDAGAVLQRVLKVLKQSASAAGATIDAQPLPTVLADELQLEQLLQNLIGNAIKFRGETPLHISVGALRQHQRWEFFVKDNGIGIEPQYADRIFQMFQRLHERGKYEGSGIGLAIVKRIVERHGGQIQVESAPGQGATFQFTLRAVPGALDPNPAADV